MTQLNRRNLLIGATAAGAAIAGPQLVTAPVRAAGRTR